MLKRSLSLLVLLHFSSLSHAETCPDIWEIRSHNLHGWRALDINNATPVSEQRYNQFAQAVEAFALAEWSRFSPEGSAHCYYNDKKHDPSYLDIYLVKHKLKPDLTAKQWAGRDTDQMQCHAYQFECRFVKK
jgi:hypothetical protein